ncbi:MAG: 4'-phosphopantetheinyl transferase superfamily protein [Chitinophagaceae bacterium]|nr:MAG: 4'-phosphopantetheinyl transferase superfamily protein [Chitinophagaceae bacterium]
MPLVYQQNINAFARLGVWHINETEDFFAARVGAPAQITHPHKRLQHLAARLLLTELYEDFPLDLIRVAETRKPFVSDGRFQFSVSHCGDYAAAIVSRHGKVGVDIEVPQEKIERLQQKFLTDVEISILNFNGYNKQQILTLAWSIKETIFKWYGDGQVNFKTHMQIQHCKVEDNQFTAHCAFLKGNPIPLKVSGIFFNGNCLTWLVSTF